MTAPQAKANTSVTLVTVTATPACFRASAICWSGGREEVAGERLTLLRDCMITNMSSMPIPEDRKMY